MSRRAGRATPAAAERPPKYSPRNSPRARTEQQVRLLWEREDFTADGLGATARDEVLEKFKRACAASESQGAISLGVADPTTTSPPL